MVYKFSEKTEECESCCPVCKKKLENA